MSVIIVIAVVLAIVAFIALQVVARAQDDINTTLGPAEINRIVEQYFGVIWTRMSGPGAYNFRPKMRMHAPTISVSIDGNGSGGCTVSVWPSNYDTAYGGMYHAGLVWRKKRGLAKRLAPQLVEPGAR